MTRQFNYCFRIVSPHSINIDLGSSLFKSHSTIPFTLSFDSSISHIIFQSSLFLNTLFFSVTQMLRTAVSSSNFPLSQSTSHLPSPAAHSPVYPFLILLASSDACHVGWGKDQQRSNKYEILPWVIFGSSVMIVVLYMHARTHTVNGP